MTNEVYEKLRQMYMESIEIITKYPKVGHKPSGLEMLTCAIKSVIENWDNLSEQEVRKLLLLDGLFERFYHRTLECGWVNRIKRMYPEP